MILRRDLLVGLACAGTLAAAEGLRPRRWVRLLPEGQSLSSIIPPRFAGWDSAPAGGDIVIPRTEGSLAARLYNQELARQYIATGAANPVPVMLLIAYGSSQSDSLQLHRPEVCYPATGFTVTPPEPITLPLAGGAAIPAVQLTASLPDRVEDIVYWSRLGQSLPRSETEQRRERLRAAMTGTIGDGMLVRASAIRGSDGATRIPEVLDFLRAMVGNVSPASRVALLGSAFARYA